MNKSTPVNQVARHYLNSDWTLEKEELPLATIEYMQIGKLPRGVRYVVQDGYREANFDKYSSFSKSGKLILIGAGKTKTEARKKTLREINIRLREVALYNHEATKDDFIKKLKEYK